MTNSAGRLSGRAVFKCLLRSSMINVAYNLRGLQNIGFTYAIMTGLRDLYPDDPSFLQSCRRYAAYHNCHPFWAPFLTGAFLHTEARIATGRLDAELFKPLKETTLNSLSAIGDSFFSGSVETVLFLFFACLLVKSYLGAVCAGLLIWLCCAIAAKAVTFYIGLSRGLAAIGLLRSFNLINIGDYIKIFGALLLVAFLTLALHAPAAGPLSFPEVLWGWVLPVAVLLGMRVLVVRLRCPRSLLVSLLLLLLGLGLC